MNPVTGTKRAVDAWLDEYGESHRDATNEAIHWVCIPLIVLGLLGLLWPLRIPGLAELAIGNAATLLVALATIYYLRLSPPLALGMLVLASALLVAVASVEAAFAVPLWQPSAAVLVVAWIGQFIGHRIEGKKPSFLKDVQFLLIGPLWLLAAVYRRLGIRY